MARSVSRGEKAYRWVCTIIVTIVALASLYPLLYIFFMSIVTTRELADSGGYILFFPKKPTLYAYRLILNVSSFVPRALSVTIIRTLIGTALHIIVSASFGYTLSRTKLPGKKILLYLLLIPLLFGAGLIPNYIAMQQLNLVNKFEVMILPNMLGAFHVLIFKQFFENIPQEIEEAALVDGVNEVQLMTTIITPLSKPVLAAISMFTVVFHWNSWFDAFLYINSSNSHIWPLQTYVTLTFRNLNNLTNDAIIHLINEANAGGYGVEPITTQMALTIVAMLPILLMYPFFQKYFTKGVYTGAVKG